MIVLLSPTGIKGWCEDVAELFVQQNTVIPTGCTGDNNTRYALLGKVKIAEEQGYWSGRTALRILEGTPASAIPLAKNRHDRLYLNMKLAKKVGIKFPVELIEQATLLEN